MTACLSPNGMSIFRGEEPCRRLLVGTTEGIVVLERGPSVDWQKTGTMLDGRHISALLIEPTHGGLFAGVHGGGVHFSADGGAHWEERSGGLTIEHVYTLNCREEKSGPVIYAGTEPVGLFRTYDYGRTWQGLPAVSNIPGKEKWMFPMPPHIAHVKTIAFDPRSADRILVGVEQGGLLETENGGQSWREIDSYTRPDDAVYRDIHQVLRRPNHPSEIFMSSGMGLYRSTDDGRTWDHLTGRDFRIGYPDKLMFAPGDDRLMFMCGAAGNPGTWRTLHTARPSVMVSRDLGESWTPMMAGLPAEMKPSIEGLSIYATKATLSLFAGTTDGEVYVSDDGANSWRRICDGLGPVSKVAHFRLLLQAGGGAGKPA